MKNINLYSLVAVIFLTFALSSCASKMAFQNSSVVPAAEGSVKVKQDKNNNYTIDLDVMRLAHPDRLSPPKQYYVVWMNSNGNAAKNIGQIVSTSNFLSNSLKSSLNAISTSKPSSFFITAEENADVQYPAGEVVLRTN